MQEEYSSASRPESTYTCINQSNIHSPHWQSSYNMSMSNSIQNRNRNEMYYNRSNPNSSCNSQRNPRGYSSSGRARAHPTCKRGGHGKPTDCHRYQSEANNLNNSSSSMGRNYRAPNPSATTSEAPHLLKRQFPDSASTSAPMPAKKAKFIPNRGEPAAQRPPRIINYKNVLDLAQNGALPTDELCLTLARESSGFLALLARVGSAQQPLAPRFLLAVLTVLVRALETPAAQPSGTEDPQRQALAQAIEQPIQFCSYNEARSKLVSELFQSQFLPTALKHFCDRFVLRYQRC